MDCVYCKCRPVGNEWKDFNYEIYSQRRDGLRQTKEETSENNALQVHIFSYWNATYKYLTLISQDASIFFVRQMTKAVPFFLNLNLRKTHSYKLR